MSLVLLPLLLLTNPGVARSRASNLATRARNDVYRASPGVTGDAPVRATRPYSAVILASDIAHAAAEATDSTDSTLAEVPVMAASFDPVTADGTGGISATTTTTTLAPPPPPTTTTTTLAPPPPPTTTTTTTEPPQNVETGEASWYEAPAGTCASPNIAFGTEVTVTDLESGLSTTCTVDDRGPNVQGRIIDLSEQTFSQLTSPSVGVIEVSISW